MSRKFVYQADTEKNVRKTLHTTENPKPIFPGRESCPRIPNPNPIFI